VPAFSQFNPFTNGFPATIGERTAPVTKADNLINYSSASGIPCDPNTFWAVISTNDTTSVDIFTLNGNTVTNFGTTIIAGLFDPNLAYCNNLNGGAFGPTFYSTQNFTQPVYFDGTGVVTTSTISPNYLINCGGAGNYLYYILYDASYTAKAIVRYTGSNITTIFNLPNGIVPTVADLAVDTYGNVWFFTGKNNSFLTDTLDVVSPGGQLLKQYPFPYNTLNAYGCFLLNRILYIGLGPGNGTHPNTIVPVTITLSTATAGTPISMPGTTAYSDMASCTPGSPLAVNESTPLQEILLFPNPVSDKLTINNNTNESLEIILYDITARELLHQFFTNSVTLDIEQLPKGIYLYKLKNKTGGEKTGKILKE
jgi:hypothetical protein